jgi:hypothetical protein
MWAHDPEGLIFKLFNRAECADSQYWLTNVNRYIISQALSRTFFFPRGNYQFSIHKDNIHKYPLKT